MSGGDVTGVDMSGDEAPSGDPAFSLDESIGFLVYRAQLVMRKELMRQFAPHDVTAEQWPLLYRLWEEDGLTQRQLADRTFKDQPTTTRICQRLEEKGLVRRSPCPEDARASRVYLTARAAALVPELIPRAERTLAGAVAGVDAARVAVAKEVLAQVFINLGST